MDATILNSLSLLLLRQQALPTEAQQCQQQSSAYCLAVMTPECSGEMEGKAGEVACKAVTALF